MSSRWRYLVVGRSIPEPRRAGSKYPPSESNTAQKRLELHNAWPVRFEIRCDRWHLPAACSRAQILPCAALRRARPGDSSAPSASPSSGFFQSLGRCLRRWRDKALRRRRGGAAPLPICGGRRQSEGLKRKLHEAACGIVRFWSSRPPRHNLGRSRRPCNRRLGERVQRRPLIVGRPIADATNGLIDHQQLMSFGQFPHGHKMPVQPQEGCAATVFFRSIRGEVGQPRFACIGAAAQGVVGHGVEKLVGGWANVNVEVYFLIDIAGTALLHFFFAIPRGMLWGVLTLHI